MAGVGVLVWEGVRNGGFGWAASRSQRLTLAGIFLEHCHTHLACFTFSETKKKRTQKKLCSIHRREISRVLFCVRAGHFVGSFLEGVEGAFSSCSVS